MPTEIRPRTPADIDECARLLVTVHARDGYPVEGVADPESWLSPAGLIRAWVGELSGSIVGHALITTPMPGDDDAADLWMEQSGEPASRVAVAGRLFVGPSARNHGMGEELARAAMEYATDYGRRVVFDVMEKDRSAIRLYERLGCTNIGSVRHRFGDGQERAARCYVAPDTKMVG